MNNLKITLSISLLIFNLLFINQIPWSSQTTIVSTATELINAIGSNKTILIKPGTYHLSSLPKKNTNYIKWEKVFDGYQIKIKNINNLNLKGIGSKRPKILVDPKYGYVFQFINAININIQYLNMGHTESGFCTGGVLRFENSRSIDIEDSILFGSGTEGITLNNVQQLNFRYSVIKECSYYIMTIQNSKDITFQKSHFHHNKEFSLINISNSIIINYLNCNVSDNNTTSYFKESDDGFNGYLFTIRKQSEVLVRNCIFMNNQVHQFLYSSSSQFNQGNNIFLNNKFKTN